MISTSIGKILRLFGTVLVVFHIAGCSGGGRGGTGAGVASRDIRGKLEINPDAGSGDPVEQLAIWAKDCEGIRDFSKTNLRKGMTIETRSDDIWKSYDPSQDWNSAQISSESVTSVVSMNEFYSVNRTAMVGSGLRVDAEFQHTMENGQRNSRRTRIISTQPPELKSEIERGETTPQQDGTSCSGDWVSSDDSQSDTTTWATLTLPSGQLVRGILTTRSARLSNYTCNRIDVETGKVVQSRHIADKVTQTISEFVAAEFINPLEASCARDNRFLRTYVIQTDTGEVVQLSKSEVTSFK